MAKTNEPSIDRPPRPGQHIEGTRQWRVSITDETDKKTGAILRVRTRVWFSRETVTPDLVFDRALSEEQLDRIRLASVKAGVLDQAAADVAALDRSLDTERLKYYRDQAPDEWRLSVGLPKKA
jgi:hypothetical protein